MSSQSNPWDRVAEHLKTLQSDKIIPDHIADTVLVAWPKIIQLLDDCDHLEIVQALDFGCGDGAFCERLSEYGFPSVLGLEPSIKMHEASLARSTEGIDFVHGGIEKLRSYNSLSLITSIMVLQFVENIDELLQVCFDALDEAGVLAFATFNPDFISSCLKEGSLFRRKGDRLELPVSEEEGIRVFERSESEWARCLDEAGFRIFHLSYPPFHQEFLRNYEWPFDAEVPEFLIVGARKKLPEES